MNWWAKIVSRFRRSPPANPEVRLREGGFDLISSDFDASLAAIDWADVDRIEAYKLDLVVIDCICLLFKVGEKEIQVSEDWIGFDTLFEPLNKEFPGINGSWYMDVMQPPFEENRTVLFSRNATA